MLARISIALTLASVWVATSFAQGCGLDYFGQPENCPVPEPGTLLMLGSGVAAVAAVAAVRRRFKKNS